MWIALVIFMVNLMGTRGVIITVSPASGSVIMDVDRLVITCSAANSASLHVVNSFQISKENTNIVSVTFDRYAQSSVFNWQDQSYNGRATVEGNVHADNTANKFLRLLIEANKTMCTDESNYTCSLQGQLQDGSPHQEYATTSIKISSNAGVMDPIYASPSSGGILGQNYGTFPTGVSVQLTCTGFVGKPPVGIRWCYKLSQDQDFSPLNSFGAVWNQSEPVPTNNCNNRRSSYLSYLVTDIDIKTILLCEPVSQIYYCGRNPLNSTFTVETTSYTGPFNKASGNMAANDIFIKCILFLGISEIWKNIWLIS